MRATSSLLTQFIGEQRFALDGVTTVPHLSAAVAQVKAQLPGDATLHVPHLQKGAVPSGSLLLHTHTLF